MPLSCRWLFVTEVSPPCKVTEQRCVRTVRGLEKRLRELNTGSCDSNVRYYFRELKSPDRWRGPNMTQCGIAKGDYSRRLWNVSSTNQIKSRIIPDGKKRETTKYESSTVLSTNATGVNMSFLIVKLWRCLHPRAPSKQSRILFLKVTIIFRILKGLNTVARQLTTKMNVALCP